MSDIMRPMSFEHLMNWILGEYKSRGSIFGVRKIVKHQNGEALPIFREKIESPYGPAAGPNTQLAQNIVAAYVAGSRFFELKTVQVMDGAELSACVSKPCIASADECYNCEWSTELYVPQAFGEYVKAWVACKLLAKELGLGDPDGFVFNMSVGYDLKGIQSEKIDKYIEGMKDAADTEEFRACIDWALANADKFENVDADYIRGISARISDSITESTLHGCPPEEIERIATYLLSEKHLNTYIKCNPTLLGYDYARKRLDSLGFSYIAFDDHHFVEDLQWKDAVPMLERLQKMADEKGLEFGVKLTNTFPVDVKAGELPSEEMYMSGRSLFPLTIHVARMISEQFGGKMRISYSGGATVFNIRQLFDAGIWPITMATDVLKPGGYERMSQIAFELMNCGSERFHGVDVEAVRALDEDAADTGLYTKPEKPLPNRHIDKALPLFDCFTAPCRSGCPIEQDIPGYLKAMEEGDAGKAFRIITERNALPFITGTICPHHCSDKCMRNYYESHLRIRGTKLNAAKAAFDGAVAGMKAPGKKRTDKNVAVIGGGPAGLSAAYFLSRAGVPVTVFEEHEQLGGVVRNAIPDFRISAEAIDRDIRLCSAYGAQMRTGVKVDSVKELFDQGYTDVIIAVGAWKSGDAHIKYGEAIDALEFLAANKKDPASTKLGTDVAVIGGGNTAMDTARAAKRTPGVKNVRLVYRRTKRYMPADEEELMMAQADGVEFMELLAPVGVKDDILTCSVMKLGDPDESGRRAPVDTGNTIQIPCTALITAVGEKVDESIYREAGAEVAKGRPVVGADMSTSAAHVYAAGDSRRGPATVVEAIADAAAAAAAIAGVGFDRYAEENSSMDEAVCLERKGELCLDMTSMPDKRCLGCAKVCEVCADVCPNRANVAVEIPGKMAQIVHVDGMCNECGNCAVFCPYSGRPYKDKFTLFWSRGDMENSENSGFLFGDGDAVLIRIDGKVTETTVSEADKVSKDAAELIRAVKENYAYLIR